MAGSAGSIISKLESEQILGPVVETVGWANAVALWRVFTSSSLPESATLALLIPADPQRNDGSR